jgi:hypothetical protein
MTQRQITVSLPQDLSQYVRMAPDASTLVAEALYRYRESEPRDEELARQYQEAAEESARLDREWSSANADLPE